MAGHVVLIGDSILDNAPYVDRDHDVTSHLKRELPGDWQVTLRAVDGSSLPHIPTQTIDLPDSTTHIVFSCGGNDALNHIDILDRPTRSVGSALRQLNRIRTDFFQEYSRVLRSLADTELPVIVLTIYNPGFDDPELQQAAEAAVCLFNDGITRASFYLGLTVIDIRCLLDQPGDLANPIEPSSIGGRKIARAVAQICMEESVRHGNSHVIASI